MQSNWQEPKGGPDQMEYGFIPKDVISRLEKNRSRKVRRTANVPRVIAGHFAP